MPYKYFTKAIFLFSFIIIGHSALNAQDTDTTVQKTGSERHYIFMAMSYSSAYGGRKPLIDGEYSIHIKNDSVISFLPYFGSSYKAQINQTDGGIKFTSTQFDYSFTEQKKGKCEITIKPKDIKDVQQLFLTVYSDGKAQLQVTSTNREPTSFTGYFIVK